MGRLRVRYKNAREEYIRCRALGIPGREYRVVARDHGVASVLLSGFNKGEYQEGLDSTDANGDLIRGGRPCKPPPQEAQSHWAD